MPPFWKSKSVEAKPKVKPTKQPKTEAPKPQTDSGVKLDTGVPFEKTVTDDELRRWVQKLVQSPQRREDSQKWASNLRLLSPLDDNQRQNSINPVANMVLSAPIPRKDKRYVAISYAWKPSDDETYDSKHPERTTYSIHCRDKDPKNQVIRKAKAPSVVIRRAVNFAQSLRLASISGFPIWIDQECIVQDDRNDIELGIQAMDLVYEGAIRSLALLTCSIQTQEQMKALEQFLKGTVDPNKEQSAILEVLNLLVNDRWFTRSWTFQESTASHDMIFLIQHSPALTNLKDVQLMGDITGEIEIPFFRLASAAATLRVNVWPQVLTYKTRPGPNAALQKYHTNLCAVVSHLCEVCPERWFKSDTFTGATALQLLERRNNKRPADRLAILANLCNFPQRINTFDAEEYQMSFSVCAYLLCIMNGDLSLVICTRNIHPSDRLAYSWGPPRNDSLRTLIDRVGIKTRAAPDEESPRLFQPRLGPEGLHLFGWIWRIGEQIDLSDAKLALVNHERWFDATKMLWLIITRLREKGKTSLAELIWSSLLRKRDRLEFNSTRHTWKEKRVHFEQNSISWTHDSHSLQDAVRQHGRLSLGYRVLPYGSGRGIPQSSPDSIKYQAIFYSAIDVGGTVLTPELTGERGAKTRQKPTSSVAWELKDPSAPILEGKAQTCGAYWTGEDDHAKPYILS